MGKSLLEKRFEELGITQEDIRLDINLMGLEPASSKRGCTSEALRHYCENVLQIKNAPLFTKDYLKSNHDLARELFPAIIEWYEEIKAENIRLKEENMKLRNMKKQEDAEVHIKLIQMKNALELRKT